MNLALTPTGFVAVGCGAMLGAWLRWGLQNWLNHHPRLVPLGTLFANLLGGLLVGIALAWFARHPEVSTVWRLALVTGFLGALTTFSTFSAESLQLIQRGQIGWAGVHSFAHLAGCLLAAHIGYKVGGG